MTVKSKQGEGQDRNVYNAFKRFMKNSHLLTNEQIAEASFELFHQARMRGGVEPT
jgi:hypothetical protein